MDVPDACTSKTHAISAWKEGKLQLTRKFDGNGSLKPMHLIDVIIIIILNDNKYFFEKRKPKSEPFHFRILTEPNRKITEPKKITENRKTENRTVWTSKTERLGFRFGFGQ